MQQAKIGNTSTQVLKMRRGDDFVIESAERVTHIFGTCVRARAGVLVCLLAYVRERATDRACLRACCQWRAC